jgi:hypothetical protein
MYIGLDKQSPLEKYKAEKSKEIEQKIKEDRER